MISHLIDRFAAPSFRVRRRSAIASARRSKLRKSLRAEPLEDRRLLANIFGFKFDDLDGDGTFDVTDTTMPGWTIFLDGEGGGTLNGTLDPGEPSMITDAGGFYTFPNLPEGTYFVTEVLQPGWVPTRAPQQMVDLPDDPEFSIGINFFNVVPGSIHGFKFEDVDADGQFNPQIDNPAANVEFTLTGTDGVGNQINMPTTTDVNGEFWITDLMPSVQGEPILEINGGGVATGYTVTETVPPGFIPTTQTSFTTSLLSREELVWEQGAAMIDNTPQQDQQQSTTDGVDQVDGTRFESQTFVPGIGGELASVSIQVDTLAGVGDVTMTIQTTLPTTGEPSGLVLGTATILSANVPIGANQSLNFDFSGAPLALVPGQSYAMVLSSPLSPAGSLAWLISSGNPYAAGSNFSSPDSGATWLEFANFDYVFTTNMIPELRREVVIGRELEFGNTITSSVHGFKFEDLDADGIYEPNDGEGPQPGVPFQLTGVDIQGNVIDRITNTDINGQFWFEGLLPSVLGQGQQTGYTLTEFVPQGFRPTTGVAQRFFDLPVGVELAWQLGAAMLQPDDPREEVVVGQELIFGNTAAVSIHGFKFEDIDGDGVYDPNDGEQPQAGVEFTLTGTDGQGNTINTTTETDLNGEFWFVGGELPLIPSVNGEGAGTGYTVTETVPDGFVSTTLPIARDFDLRSREEIVWATGRAMLPQPPPTQPDQTQQINDGIAASAANTVQAQTFVPGFFGSLTQVDIEAGTNAAVGDVTLDIETVNGGGQPSGDVLASVTIPAANVPIGDDVTLSFVFPAPPALVPGVEYAMLLSSPGGAAGSLGWDFGNGDPYPAGNSFQSLDTGATFGPTPGIDYVFTTTMQPPIDPRIEVLINDTGQDLIWGNTVPGSIHGFKFLDSNGNGQFDPNLGEQPQPGVDFQLTGTDGLGNPINLTETTDASGQFWFVGVPPSVAGQGQGTGYTITEIVPAGFIPTTLTQRTFDLQSREELVWQDGAAMLSPDALQFEVNVAVDLMFGNIGTGSLHGFKFEDADGDGVYNPASGDTAQANVDFQLTGTDNAGNPVNLIETTDATGQFWFEDLFPSVNGQGLGTGYTITEIVPAGFVATTPTLRFFNLPSGIEFVWQQGAAMLDPNDPQVEEVVGDQLIFGNTVPGSIHGFKFEDLDADGVFNPAFDVPLAGVDFTLTGTDGQGNVINTTETTDVNGEFWFMGLLPSVDGQGPGTGYTVTEAVPAGFVATTPTVFSSDLRSRQELVAVAGQAMIPPDDPRTEVLVGMPLMFGNTVPVSIHGFKFEDLDRDGIYEPNEGEPPQANVQFTLTGTDGQGNVINRIEFTNPNGEFWFVELLPSVAGQGPGTGYTVTEVLPAGFISTTPPLARTFDLQSRQELVWRVGAAMLPTGDPRVEILTDPDESGFDENLIWGNFLPGQIHGYKFNDLDGDGVPDPGEPRLAGFEIQLLDGDGVVVATEFTDPNGDYWFLELIPGTYFVREVQQPGYQQTTHDSPPILITRGEVYVAQAGQSMLDPSDDRDEIIEKCLIFGNVLTASIHGVKIFDANRNGVNDGLDQPQQDVTFTITTVGGGVVVDAAGVPVGPQTTNQNGEFWFENLLAGTYVVTETVPEGQISTSLPISRVFTVDPGQELVAVDGQAMLGPNDNRQEVNLGTELEWLNTTPPGAIHGYKFEDLDGDGVVDVGEERLGGFEIQLLNPLGVVLDTTTTDLITGEYWFVNLEPGTYFVREVQQPGFQQTTHDPQPIVITSSEVYVAQAGQGMLGPDDPRTEIIEKCLIFGNVLTASIHGFKFQDLNRNGSFDAEPPQAGVTFNLTTFAGAPVLDAAGLPVGPQITDVNGEFWYTNLLPGTYIVSEVVPDGQDSTTLPESRTFTIFAGQEIVAFVGQSDVVEPDPFREEILVDGNGFRLRWGNAPELGSIHGHKWEDINGDGIEDVDEPRLNGWTITITNLDGGQVIDAFGNIVQPQVTQSLDLNGDFNISANEIGLYWFEFLLPGTYIVREQAQPLWKQTSHNPQPITITGGQEYVAQLGQEMFEEGDDRDVIVDKCLSFGNQRRGKINWRKETKTGLLGGVIFELTRTHSFDQTTGLFTDIVDEPITVVDNLAPDTNETFGLFMVQDLLLGRYTLRESVPVPGYDPDLFVETFNITDFDPSQDATHIFFNSWSKRAFVGSTLALRLAYLEQIGLTEATLNQQQLEQVAIQAGQDAEPEQFRMSISVEEDSDTNNVVMIHEASGNLVAEGELASEFAVVTTDLDEHVKIAEMPNHVGPLTIDTAGGDDVIDVSTGAFESLDAGEGQDVLRFMAAGTFDLVDVVDRIESVEEIALAGEGEQQIMLDRASVRAASANAPLHVRTQRSGQLNVDGSWTISAPIRSGDDIVQVLKSGSTILHVTSDMPFQNALNRFDVDGSGGASALDALQIINGLARGEGEAFSSGVLTTKYFDVNGDGRWSALDALQVINQLTRNHDTASEGQSVAGQTSPADIDSNDLAIQQYEEFDVTDQEQVIGPFAVGSATTRSAFDGYGQAGSDADDDEEFDLLLTTIARDLSK